MCLLIDLDTNIKGRIHIMKKKLITGILMTTMLLTFAACGEVNEGNFSMTSKSSETSTAQNEGEVTTIMAKNLSAGIEVNEENLNLAEISEDENDTMNSAVADFSIDLMKESLGEEDGRNVLISAESALYALAMTGNGAAGENLSQFEEVLAGGQSMEMLNGYLANKVSGDEQISLANSIWIRDDEGRIKVNDDFLNINKAVYDADTFTAPFDDSTLTDINNWVNDKTEGMIPQIINDVNPEAVMYLINATTFDSKWTNEYEDYNILEDETFTNFQGDEEQVTMLHSEENTLLKGDGVKGFVRPYDGGKYAFVGILPDENVDLNDYVNSLTGESWLEMYENRTEEKVIAEIPEFSTDYDTYLNFPLQNMGLKDAFTEGADFSNMAQTSSGVLYIGNVIHKTHIEVDREGTKAAAVTAIEMTDECIMEPDEEIPEYIVLDRPFLYAIVESDTGLPIFMGTLNTCK